MNKRKLKAWYQTHRNLWCFRGLRFVYRKVRHFWQELVFCKDVREIEKRKQKEKPVHIVFLVQLMALWGKTEPVFLEAQKRSNVRVTLLAVPENPEDGSGKHPAYECLKQYGDIVRNAVEGDEWLSLKELCPDYVFYPRPYDDLLPQPYRSSVVRKYAKVCYIPYGFLLTETCLSTCLNEQFYKNCYCYFAENTLYANYNRKRFGWTHVWKKRKSLATGYPAFTKLEEAKGQVSTSWEAIRSKVAFKVIWTPRWTTEKRVGGSNFFRYKDELLHFADTHKDFAIVYRPHPLTFQNFLKTGELTEEELRLFREKFENSDSLYIEEKPDYYDTFWESDVLVTDVSSVDIEYFLTGKPVIYCYRDSVQFSEFAEKLYQSAYLAKNWEEVSECLQNLKNGMDPLKDKRMATVRELLGTDFATTPQRMIDEIVTDYAK